MSESGAGGMAVETELSLKYSTMFYCCATDGSRGTEWHLTWKWMWMWSQGVSLYSSIKKKWHSLTLVDSFWMFMETKLWMCSEAVGSVFHQWQLQYERQTTFWMIVQIFQGQHAGSCTSLVKNHSWWWWLCWKGTFCRWEFALSNYVSLLFVSNIVSLFPWK